MVPRRLRHRHAPYWRTPSPRCPTWTSTFSMPSGSCPTNPSPRPTLTSHWPAPSRVTSTRPTLEFAESRRRAESLSYPQGPFSLGVLAVLRGVDTAGSGPVRPRLARSSQRWPADAELHGFDSFGFIAATEGAAAAAFSTSITATRRPDCTPDPHRYDDHAGRCLARRRVEAFRQLLRRSARRIAHRGRPDRQGARANSHRLDPGRRNRRQLLLRGASTSSGAAPPPTTTPAPPTSPRLSASHAGSAHSSFELRSAIDDYELRGDDARQALIDAIDLFSEGQQLAGTGPGAGTAR